MPKFIKLAGLIGVVLGLAFASNASAAGGDPQPDVTEAIPTGVPSAVCVVSGKVTVPTTPQGTVGHSDYDFVQSALECVENGARVTYAVTANGDSWGPPQAGLCPAAGPCTGSSTLASWSDNSAGGYVAACGETTAAQKQNKGNITAGNSNGFVKFVRGAPETIAWGTFCSGALSGLSFTANMLFTPDPLTPAGARTTYNLTGAAVIY